MKNFTIGVFVFLFRIACVDAQVLPLDFESATITYTFTDFGGGKVTVIPNPQINGINTSAKVGQMVKSADQVFGGSFISLASPIDFSANKLFKVKVYSPRVGAKLLLKVENATNSALSFEKDAATTVANAWEELTIDYTSISTANQYSKIVLIFDNGTMGDGSANFTYLFDDIKLVAGAGPPTLTQMNLPVTFDDATVNYGLVGFGGADVSTITVDPTLATNKVAKVIKSAVAEGWAGTTITGLNGTVQTGFSSKIPFTAADKKMKMRVWSPNAGIKVRLKVESHLDPTKSVETEVTNTVANAWEMLTFDFGAQATGTEALNLGLNYNKASVFFNFGVTGATAGEKTYYFDDVSFVTGVTPPATSEPTTAAATPTREASKVISLFSNAYTNVTVNTWRTDWSAATLADIQIAGNATKKYTGLDFVGIEATGANAINASSMLFLHVDAWTPNMTTLRIKLVDFGPNGTFAGGDDKEHELVFTPKLGEWNGYEIPLADFTGLTTKANISQIILSGLPTGSSTLFIDNVYFHSVAGGVTPPPTEPTTAAATPTREASKVISLFSNAYTNVTVNTWRTDWSAATLADIQIAGNATKKYTGLDFVGIEATGANAINASSMLFLHVDAWTPNMTTLRIKLVDFGPNGTFAGGDDKEHELVFTPKLGEWNGYEIPLADFTGLTTKANISQIILSGLPTGSSTLFIDNVYFHSVADGGGTVLTQMNLPVTFDDANVNYGLIGFGGADASTIVADPTLATNKVARVVKSAGAEVWAGTTITAVNGNIQTGFSSKIPFTSTNKKMNIRVWSPNAGIKIRLKVEDANDVNKYVEVDVTNTVANNWEVLTFDFANPATAAFDASFNYNKASIFFNFGVTGATAGEKTYYFDDVNFGAPKQAQTITFAALTDKTLGDAAFTLAATASSSLAVAYTTTTSDKITLAGTQVTLVKAGRASVTAAQAGNDSYFPATPITQTFCIKPAKPTITTGTATATGVTLTSNATAGNQWYLNGNAITGATNSTYVATAAGTYKVQVKVDDCISDFSADNVITKSAQTITFPAITTKTLTSAAFTLGATASSGLAVTYATTSTDKITLVGNQVTAVKAAGKATITATQTGNDLVASATAVSVDFCITPAKPTVTTSGINTAATVLTSSATTGNQWYLGATAISGATSPTYTIAAAGIYKVQVTIDGCASDFSAESTFIVTGDLTSQNSSIVVYPNPVETSLQIKGLSGESFTAQVVDLTGRATSILLEKTDDAHKANVEGLSQGFYVLTVREGGQLVKLKFIKK